MNAASLKLMVRHFWQGGYSLGLSFWMFGVLGSLLPWVVVQFLLDESGTPSLPAALVIGLGGIAYQTWAVVGIWRSAGNYQGPPRNANAARFVVALYGAFGLLMLLQVAAIVALSALVFLNPPFIK